ncbi:GMC oxidoreductase-like protein [Thozetella sp. PMI_491]|nr:GMC oxidoreductase-like protein [Thozetella sp. PMI_491]
MIPKKSCATITALIGFTVARQDRLFSSTFAIPGRNATYDYVVVGGGTAGLAIATRLAEHFTVAVVEAGGFYEFDNGNQSVVPYYALGMAVLATDENYPRQPLVDWDLVSTPQASAGNRRIHYARGKTLGGCTALNTMAYLRPTVGTHKLWAEQAGDESYEWENALPFYKKSCTLNFPNEIKRNDTSATVKYDPETCAVAGGSGPVQVSWGNWVDPTTSWLARGLRAIGMPLGSKGFSSGTLNGIGGWVSSTIDPKDATRSSAETSYLREAISRSPGLSVYPHTQTTKILFRGLTATGVTVDTHGLAFTLSAGKEVILSAGVIHSPQLLMVSGIGPAATLQSLGIPVTRDLPGVGQNLWDQVSFNVLQGISTETASGIVADPSRQENVLREYLDDQAGPYSSAGGYFSFEKIPDRLRVNFSQPTKDKLSKFPGDWPEIEYVVFGFAAGPNTTIGVVSATLISPLSRGSVTISSASMADPPVVDLGWLNDPADGEVAVAALKRCREAWASSALDPVRSGPEIAPGADVITDAQILDYIRTTASTVWHASATCKMGRPTDPMAVVDSEARVLGLTGLRVVDASVFPFAVPPNPQGTVYMLAEKIASVILRGNASL